MVRSNGVQNKKVNEAKEKEVEFPETWEALLKQEPMFELLPALKPAEEFSYRDARRFKMMETKLSLAYARSNQKDLDAEEVVTAIDMRGEATDEAIDFYKSLTDEPDQVDVFTTGVDADAVFLLLFLLTSFYQDQLGKSYKSKSSSTRTESN